ncbi:hypothetical protein N9E14_05335 [Flavobacteriaceae bacterium]|nr:hypothetical protein [Flavobacteriaceae bacterium]
MKYFFLLFPLIISAQLTNISGFVKSESGNLGYAPNQGINVFVGYKFNLTN